MLWKKPNSFQRYGTIGYDSCTVKNGLVFDDHTEKIIGFADNWKNSPDLISATLDLIAGKEDCGIEENENNANNNNNTNNNSDTNNGNNKNNINNTTNNNAASNDNDRNKNDKNSNIKGDLAEHYYVFYF